MSEDLNIPDPSKPCVSMPELVAIACPEPTHGTGRAPMCPTCGGLGSVLIDRARLKVLAVAP